MPKLSEVKSLDSHYLMPFAELCGKWISSSKKTTHPSFLCQLIDVNRLWHISFPCNYKYWMCKYVFFSVCFISLFFHHPKPQELFTYVFCSVLGLPWTAYQAMFLVLITKILPSKESQRKMKTHDKVELLTNLGKAVQLFLAVWETRNSIREETAEQCRGRTEPM